MKNDSQVQQILSPAIATLFEAGYRPEIDLANNPELLREQSNDEISTQHAHGWLSIRIWMDLFNIKKASEQDGNMEAHFEHTIDLLDIYGTKTIMNAGEIVRQYNLNPLVKDLDKELKKIPTSAEKENFKQNFLADTLNATEIRILVWMYKELFNKNYKLKVS